MNYKSTVFTVPFLVLLCASLRGQAPRQSPQPTESDKQIRWIKRTLEGSQVTIYVSDGKKQFYRATFVYQNVDHPDRCELTYEARKNEVSSEDNAGSSNEITAASLDLGDIARSRITVDSYSSLNKAAPGTSYTMDAWVVGVYDHSGGLKHSFELQTRPVAERFARSLKEIGTKCQQDSGATS